MGEYMGIMLSKSLVKLLQWDLPASEIPYNLYNGSASVLIVTRYLRADDTDIKMAISDGSKKPRLFLFQLGNEGKHKICELGDMGFQSSLPRGTGQFQKCQSHLTPFLFMKLHQVEI